jgi:gliding motility-associated-like protein
MKIISVIILFILLVPSRSSGWHIIGGELYYTCTGFSNYEITLKIYRDCNSTTPFDHPAIIGIYNSSGLQVQLLSINFPGANYINADLSDPCIQMPPGVCVEQAVYKTTVNLSPIAGGYNLAYQRCCRNNTIVNIIDPENTGATFTAHIPQTTSACNSSPRFNNYPPIVICVDKPLIFDHSATDPDGDSLVYSLCTPYQGANAVDPIPIPPPPPYDPIIWQPPYNVNNQIGGSPAMNIDPATGLLTGFPTDLGQYVVGVCVKEYRDGIYLGEDIRDFQFNMTTCNALIQADFTAQNVISLNDTLLICGSNTVNFTNESFGSNDYFWDFGVPGISSDISTEKNPIYTFPDTGVYHVMLTASPGIICGDTTFRYVEIRKGVTSDFSFVSECAETPIEFADASIPIDGILSSWHWDFGDGTSDETPNPSHSFTNAGTYNVALTVYNNYGCVSTIMKPIIIFSLPVINAGPDTFVCDLDSVTLHAEGGVAYQWTPDYNISDPFTAEPLVAPDVTTVYSITVTTDNGCIDTDSVTVMITDTVVATTINDTLICEGEFVNLFVNNGLFYQWTPDSYLSNSAISNPVATPLQSITYFVTSYIGSCFDEDTVTITVLDKPEVNAGDDVTINQGESVQLNATGEGILSWSPSDNLSNSNIANPIASPLNTMNYTIQVTGNNGCVSFDSVTVNVTHFHLIIVPNAFTPNGDGLNDNFQFFTKGIKEIVSVQIFNRWGQLVYGINGNEEGWNGLFNGEASEMGTYIYRIHGISYDDGIIAQKGSVILLR